MQATQMPLLNNTISLERYPKQAAFVSTQSHFAAFIGGIFSAKSYSGSLRGLMAAHGFIGSRQIIPTPNLGIITAPTYGMLRDATLRTFLEIAGDLIADLNKSEMRVVLTNGSEILFRSTDNPETLRGPSVAWAMLDEAALSEGKTWDILIGRLRQFGQLGYIWVCSTPRGRNWIWQKFVQTTKPDYRLFKAKSKDNPYVDPAIVAAWEDAYVGDFARQELEGEFVAFEGLIYPEFNREHHVSRSKPERFNRVVAGVDWGFTNPGVIVVFGIDSDERMWGLHEEHRRQRRIEEWAEVAKELRDTYNINQLYCDPSEPDYIKAFTDKGLKAEAADNTVSTGIQRVKNRLVKRADGKPRLTLSNSFPWSISEFDQYQWKPTPKGEGYRDEPLKANDHCMDSIRYAVMGVDGRTKKGEVVTELQRYG